MCRFGGSDRRRRSSRSNSMFSWQSHYVLTWEWRSKMPALRSRNGTTKLLLCDQGKVDTKFRSLLIDLILSLR